MPASTLSRWIIELEWPRRTATVPRVTASVESEAGAAPHPPPLRGGNLSREREREGQVRSTPASRSTRKNSRSSRRTRAPSSRPWANPAGRQCNMSLVERKRRADIIASLSRSIERIDRTFEACAEREALKRLVKKQQDKIYDRSGRGSARNPK